MLGYLNRTGIPVYIHHSVDKRFLIFAKLIVFRMKRIKCPSQVLSHIIFISTRLEKALIVFYPLTSFIKTNNFANQ